MAKQPKFVDYYQVLLVWPTASEDVIKKAYFKMAKVHHPDVAKDGSETNEEDGVDFKLINEAYSILSDPHKRREFDELLKAKGGGGQPAASKEADRRSAQLAFDQARAAMKQNRYDKAVVLLESAVKYDDSNPAYFSWFGFALGALSTRLHEARDMCKKALEMEFYNADYHANLGFVYYQAGLKSTSIECFTEALKWDPDHALALKYLNRNAPGGAGAQKGFFDKILGFFGMLKKPEPTGNSR